MAYRTYTTEAIVCGSKPSMTSDKSYLLFTREAGMLWASARSVREERSRQRYALQDFSLIRVSLVKGKSGWRIGSVESVMNPFMQAHSRLGRTGVAYLVKLIRRYVHGEQPIESVFDDMATAFLLTQTLTDVTELVRLQQVAEVRLLRTLGYVADTTVLHEILREPQLTEALQVYTSDLESAVSRAIGKAAEVSHL